MTEAAKHLSSEGMVLRSGGAHGADAAFEKGADPERMEIYIPFDNFNGKLGTMMGIIPPQYMTPEAVKEAFRVAEAHHPAWDKLNRTVKFIMARNSFQVLGADMMSPAMFVLCFTHGGTGGGGTGQAIRIANSHGIPVYDLGGNNLPEIEEGMNNILQNATKFQKLQAMVPF
jgi:hypothetical protein